MKFQCDICEKIFKTNQHLTQHKNKKKPCTKINETHDKSKINNQNVLEILSTQKFLIQQNANLQNTVKQLEEEIVILNKKKDITKNFIKYILATDYLDDEIYKNISSWITKAKYKQFKQVKYSDTLSTNSILPSTNFTLPSTNFTLPSTNFTLPDFKKKISPVNSIISDITLTPSLDYKDNTNYSKL